MSAFALPGAPGNVDAPSSSIAFAFPGVFGGVGFVSPSGLLPWVFAMASATSAFAITPSDTADLPGITTGGIIVGVAGTVVITLAGGITVSFNLAAGYFPIAAKRIWSTGTTATGISGLLNGA